MIDTGSGSDLAWFRPILHPPSLFQGLDLSVRTGGGGDQVLIENLAFVAPAATASRVAIDTAGGDDVVTLDHWVSDAGIFGPEESLPGVNLSVKTGAGRDTFSFVDANLASDVSPKMQVDLGGGDDAATFGTNTFGGDLSLGVTGGAGDDGVTIHGNLLAGLGNFEIGLGSGEDRLLFAMNACRPAPNRRPREHPE